MKVIVRRSTTRPAESVLISPLNSLRIETLEARLFLDGSELMLPEPSDFNSYESYDYIEVPVEPLLLLEGTTLDATLLTFPLRGKPAERFTPFVQLDDQVPSQNQLHVIDNGDGTASLVAHFLVKTPNRISYIDAYAIDEIDRICVVGSDEQRAVLNVQDTSFGKLDDSKFTPEEDEKWSEVFRGGRSGVLAEVWLEEVYDRAPLPADQYVVSVNWGDGTTTQETPEIMGNLLGLDFYHSYKREGMFYVSATLTRPGIAEALTFQDAVEIMWEEPARVEVNAWHAPRPAPSAAMGFQDIQVQDGRVLAAAANAPIRSARTSLAQTAALFTTERINTRISEEVLFAESFADVL